MQNQTVASPSVDSSKSRRERTPGLGIESQGIHRLFLALMATGKCHGRQDWEEVLADLERQNQQDPLPRGEFARVVDIVKRVRDFAGAGPVPHVKCAQPGCCEPATTSYGNCQQHWGIDPAAPSILQGAPDKSLFITPERIVVGKDCAVTRLAQPAPGLWGLLQTGKNDQKLEDRQGDEVKELAEAEFKRFKGTRLDQYQSLSELLSVAKTKSGGWAVFIFSTTQAGPDLRLFELNFEFDGVVSGRDMKDRLWRDSFGGELLLRYFAQPEAWWLKAVKYREGMVIRSWMHDKQAKGSVGDDPGSKMHWQVRNGSLDTSTRLEYDAEVAKLNAVPAEKVQSSEF